MKNLDKDYFNKKLAIILRDIDLYTPEELAFELARVACTSNRLTAFLEVNRIYNTSEEI